MDDQRALARVRVESRRMATGQDQVDLVLEPGDVGHRSTGHDGGERARVTLAHDARLVWLSETRRLATGPLHNFLYYGSHLENSDMESEIVSQSSETDKKNS